MAFHLPPLTPASPLRVFLWIAFAGIALGVFLAHWQWREELMANGQPTLPPHRLFYGRKLALHVAPETLTGKALGADFAEVYVAALAARDIREKGASELHSFRPVAYPPLTLWLYGWFRGLAYAQALSLHSLIPLGAFLLAVALVFRRAGLVRHFWKIALLILAVCFYTPAGFSHYERGQFDLYVTIAIFLSLATVYLERAYVPSALFAGFFAALKFSSLPFLGTFSLAAFASDGPGRRRVYLIAPAVIALTLLLFAAELGRFADALNHMEWAADKGIVPVGERTAIRGVSFQLILPAFLAKSLQLFSMLAFIAAARLGHLAPGERHARFLAAALPFALAMVVQGMAYGAGSWEYRIVSLLGIAASFVLWVENVPGFLRIKTALAAGFALFLLAATRVFHFVIWEKPSWQAPGMSALYLIFSLGCLALSIWLLRTGPCSRITGEVPGRA